MKTIAVFHPSNDLYGADRILINALMSFPVAWKKVLYIPKEGPLTAFAIKNVENLEVVIMEELPIIYRSLYTPRGLMCFLANMFRFRKRFNRENKKHTFDLAYVNTLSCAFSLVRLKRLEIKSFVHVHEIIESPKIVAYVTALLLDLYANYVICVSDAVKRNLIRQRAGLVKKIFRIYNGIVPVSACRKDSDKVQFYLFGRIMPKKGQWFLLEALKDLPLELREKCAFAFVGSAPPGSEQLQTDLEDKIKEYGFDSFVTMKGFCSDISSEMSKADVCLVPSLMKDPFPTVVLEAMSAGRPVIATNHGGAAEIIDDGKVGYLVSPGDTSGLLNSIIKMIREREGLVSLGNAGQQKFFNDFTMEKFAERWRRIHMNKIQF